MSDPYPVHLSIPRAERIAEDMRCATSKGLERDDQRWRDHQFLLTEIAKAKGLTQ